MCSSLKKWALIINELFNDQPIISPHKINTLSSRQVRSENKENRQLRDIVLISNLRILSNLNVLEYRNIRQTM